MKPQAVDKCLNSNAMTEGSPEPNYFSPIGFLSFLSEIKFTDLEQCTMPIL